MGARARWLLVALTLAATPAFAKWANLSVCDLLPDTQLAVVATLRDVREWSEGPTDFGEGSLVVESVVFGESPTTAPLRLTWANKAEIVCPRVEQKGHVGVRALWLLTADRDKAAVFHADYPRRFISLADTAGLAAELKHMRKEAPKSLQTDPRYLAVTALLGRTAQARP